MEVAEVVSRRSRCSRAKVGAVVVAADGIIESTGYNGPPSGFPATTSDCLDFCTYAQNPQRYVNGNYDACPSVHAETNALAHVDRTRVTGGTLYVNSSCCMTCAKLVANSGVERVVVKIRTAESYRNWDSVYNFFRTCGVQVQEVRGE